MTLAESHILIVDDEPVLRLTFSIVLRQAGATVLAAGDGAEALRILEGEQVDAMLTDKQMPVMDGLSLLRRLREMDRQVPSVLFVNGIDSESQTEMARLGVVETVTKPIHPTELQEVLVRVLAPLPSRVAPLHRVGHGDT